MYAQCEHAAGENFFKNTLEKVFSYKKKIMTNYLPDLGRQLIAINWGNF